MRLERAQAQLLGQRKGVAVVRFGRRRLWSVAMRHNRAEEAQGIRLVAAFLVCTGECQRPRGEGVRLLQATSLEVCLP
jgi:hypothetical protein